MSNPETVFTDEKDGVLTITLNRPKANAIDVETSGHLYRAFLRIATEPHLRVGIVTGSGRFFSAGWDLKAANEGESITSHYSPGGFAGLTELFTLSKPVIAAVNGLAIRGGFELALAADSIVCTHEAEFALPEAQLGMLASSDAIEGPLAFAQKRSPHWQGC